MAYTPELLAEKKRIEQHVKIGSEALYLTKAECMENGPTVEDTIAAVRKTFIAHGKKEYEMPAKIGVTLTTTYSTTLCPPMSPARWRWGASG